MFRSLRYRNYRLLFFGQIVSLTGGWMQQLAQSWLVYRLTRDPFHLGMVGFMGQVPVLFLSLYAGVLADRLDRRRLTLATQCVAFLQACVLAGLTVSGRIQLWQVYVLAFVLGTVTAFDLPARQVLICDLVEPQDRPNAIALNSTIVNGTRVLGPALAGVLVGVWGEGICFIVNAASYVAVLAALCAMRGLKPAPGDRRNSAWSEIADGTAYVLGADPIRMLLFLIGTVGLAGMPFFVLLPVFAEEVLGAGSAGLGWLMASSGVGATAGALVLAKRRALEGMDRLVVATTAAFGVALIGFAFSQRLWLSCFFLALVGLGVMLQLSVANALLQDLSKERFRGRVMGFYTMMFLGVAPLGSFAAGSLAKHVGASWTVALGAACCIVIALRHLRAFPRVVAEYRLARAAGLETGLSRQN